MSDWKTYRKTGLLEARPLSAGELDALRDGTANNISVSFRPEDLVEGAMLGRQPDDHNDLWVLSPAAFAKYEEIVGEDR